MPPTLYFSQRSDSLGCSAVRCQSEQLQDMKGIGLKSASRDHRRHSLGFDRCESTFGFSERLCRVTTVDEHCLFCSCVFRRFRLFRFFRKKAIGPDALENAFGSSGGGSGKASGGIRGGPRGILGHPEGVLGWSWALLGGSWSDLERRPISDRFFIDFGCQKGGIWGGQREPKSIPKRPPNDAKSKTVLNSHKNTLQDRLEAILGRS